MFSKFLQRFKPLKDDFKSFDHQLSNFIKLNVSSRFPVDRKLIYPCLNDNTDKTSFDAHYIYHPAWAARIVKKIQPSFHVDISSTLHFCSILSAFVTTKFYDFRPASINLDNLESAKADLTYLFFETDSLESISCMHTI